jgi:very-short-patch-repair endonuclease
MGPYGQRPNRFRCGLAWRGEARPGEAWLGEAGRGSARQGMGPYGQITDQTQVDEMDVENRFRSSWETRLGRTDSPIESLFLESFCYLAEECYGYAVSDRLGDGLIKVVPQLMISKMRVDFGIEYEFHGEKIKLAVECDGHEWHDRNKQQATRDKRRDRVAARLGWLVQRFTGSELNESAAQCAFEILDEIMRFQTAVVERSMRGSL